MSRIGEKLDPSIAARLREEIERQLSPEELAARLAVPISERERADTLDLVDWFMRRYPSGAERLAYVRRAYARWTRGR